MKNTETRHNMENNKEKTYEVFVLSRISHKAYRMKGNLTEAQVMLRLTEDPNKYLGCHVFGVQTENGLKTGNEITMFRVGMPDELDGRNE